MNKNLNFKQRAFCHHYLANGLNAAKAAISAGYSKATAKETGSRLLTFVNLTQEIKRLQDDLAETAGISSLMIAREHAKIAFSSVANLHNTWIKRKELEELTEGQRACIQEISTKVTKVKTVSGVYDDVEFIRIKTYDKQKSLDALSNLLGYNAPVKNEVTGKDGKDLVNRLTDEELALKVAELTRKLNLGKR